MADRQRALAASLLLLCSCGDKSDSSLSGTGLDTLLAASSSSAPAEPKPQRALELQEAELSRRAELVQQTDLADRQVGVRRAAAQALARIGGAVARAGLLRALGDEDEQVVAWAAYGLGYHCAGQREPTVSALVASWPTWLTARGKAKDQRLSATAAIARAVGQCASLQSEPALVAWSVHARQGLYAPIFALGDVASHHKKLREETVVELLKLAAGDATNAPVGEALYPIGRLTHLPPSVIERTREVTQARLAQQGPARIHAIRALSRTDGAAAPPLRQVALDAEGYTPAERVEAVKGLARLGREGREARIRVLDKLVPDTSTLSATALMSDRLGVLLTLVQSFARIGKARRALTRIAELKAPDGASPAVLRRLSHLRCAVGRILAERDYNSPLVAACDLTGGEEPGSIGARAIVAAIGIEGAAIKGKRLAAWRQYATGEQLRARQDAVRQIGLHLEIKEAPEILAKALASEAPGLIAAAATVIAEHPARARLKPKKKDGSLGKIHPDIESALLSTLDRSGRDADLEALAAAIDAAGGLVLEPAKAKLEAYCQSPYPTLREHAKKALLTLVAGKIQVRCEPSKDGAPPPAELAHLATQRTTIKLQSDAGELTLVLDPTLAPVAVTRVIDLARSGFYQKTVVHRVVPGFVSQLGSPSADGYGGAPGALPLPCETSPVTFAPLSVGVALAGRDTGSSQIFVTHSSYPYLDGRYAWLGTAEGPWAALVDGDGISEVEVQP